MKPREHRREHLTTFNPMAYPDELKDVRGKIQHKLHVEASPDNRSLMVMVDYGFTDSAENLRQHVFGGNVVGQLTARHVMQTLWSMSFDGTKLAVAIPGHDDKGDWHHKILINGELVHEVKLNRFYMMQWISNDELAWHGWNEDHRGRPVGDHKFFVNGEETTGKIEFECFYPSRDVPWFTVFREGQCTMMNEDGSTAEQWEAEHKGWRNSHWEKDGLEIQERPDELEDIIDYDHRGVRIKCRGVTGPRFDELHSIVGDLQVFSYTRDRSKVGYVGKRFPFYSYPLQLAGFLVAFISRQVPDYHADSPGGRYHPVSNGREWRRSYRYIHDHLYTSDGEFVIVAHTSHGQRVVIEEVEGPFFDEVHHPRYFEDEGCLCYIGRLGNDYYRVTVDA